MGLSLVPTGTNPPDEVNVIIEIPKDAEPVKYEVDKETGAIFVDRILSTPMRLIQPLRPVRAAPQHRAA